MTKAEVLKFIKQHNIGVIATVGDGGPEAAVVGFSETDDLELIIGTEINSRKYQNLQANPRAAFVIGWDQRITVQYEGQAYLPPHDEKKWFKIHAAKLPWVAKYADEPSERCIVLRPSWIRYTDTTKTPWQVEEVEL